MRSSAQLLSSLASLLLLGCGSSVEVPSGSAGAASGTGAGGATTSSSTGAGAGGASATSSSSGAGGGEVCGGEAGLPCSSPSDFCDYSDNECGGNDGSGLCTPRPQGCPEIYQPTCGCDGKVHSSPCDANASGFDQNELGGCTPPAGTFGCGAGFCPLATSYCEHDVTTSGQLSSTYACKALPPGCGGAPSCACLMGVMCGGTCMPTANGGAQVTCESK